MRNICFAIRGLAKNPVVSIVAILSLALGIGANTAIFSLFEQTLLRNLPVAEPMELVNLTANGPRSGSNSTTNAGGCCVDRRGVATRWLCCAMNRGDGS